MTEVMSLEAAKYNIRVNALAPGYFLTDVSRILLESPMSTTFRQSASPCVAWVNSQTWTGRFYWLAMPRAI